MTKFNQFCELLITSVLKCASDRLAISLSLSCIFSGVLICSFIWAFFFFLSWRTCYVEGRSLRCSPGWGNGGHCTVTLSVGEGSEREQWCLLYSLPDFSHSLRYPQSNWALLVLLPSVCVCVHSRTLCVSPANSPVRLGVSPAAASTPTDIFNQWFEVYFPGAGTLGCKVCCQVHQLLPCRPAAALPTLLHNPLLRWVCLAHPSPPATVLPRDLLALLPISAPPTERGG